MYPSALSWSVRASSTAILTLPDTSLTRQDPHVPERQALSMKTPAPSAASRIVASTGINAVMSEVWKKTLPADSADAAPFDVGSRLTVPNASVLIWAMGTPSVRSAAFVASIIDGGPHMCARRL